MSYNYNFLRGLLKGRGKTQERIDALDAVPIQQKHGFSSKLFIAASVFSLFGAANAFAQTTIINPLTDGGFNSGNTFAANGWTVANEGISPIKWAVGKAASGTTAVGALTSGSASVTLTAANSGIVVGQTVYGDNIPMNTFVQAISGTTLTLSQNATGNVAAATLGFGQFGGGISVNTTQTTLASIAANTYKINLSSANPNISVGMEIAPIPGVIGANTYVAGISGAALSLSKPTLNTSALATAQTLSFAAIPSSAILGNAAYISNDNGATNSFAGYSVARTVYFYRDITNVPASESAMTLTFDVKSAPSSQAGWQVWVAPVTQAVVGSDTQVTAPLTYGSTWPGAPGAVQISLNAGPQLAVTRTTAFIPKSFAGKPFRLIFVWANGNTAGTLPPATIDNISLVSRAPEEITCAHSGLWSQPGTWDGGKVPTPADLAALDGADESVMIDSRYSGCEDLIMSGTNSLIQFADSGVTDEFTVTNDLTLSGSGARFNNHDGTNGKTLKLGHNLDIAAGARFDSNIGSTSAFAGRLTLNGSTLQTITAPVGSIGGSVAGVNTTSNVAGVLSQLEVTNTSTLIPNVIWNVDGVRIKNNLILTTGRVGIATGKRLILGNFGTLSNITCPVGYGFTSGTLSKWIAGANTKVVPPGTEYPGTDSSYKTSWYPFVSGAGLERTVYLLPDTNPTTAGEVGVTYTDATSVTSGLTIPDGSYTINTRYNGNWAFSTPDSNAVSSGTAVTYANAGTNRVGIYSNGAYEALDGSSRLMNLTAAMPGTHQDGTAQPFVFRTGLTMADLTAAPVYVGVGSASVINKAAAITSAKSGDWNAASTWVGSVVPTCNSVVNIASGHTVTVSTAASSAAVIIAQGATLINDSGANTMIVGTCNNATYNNAFSNYGTHTMASGNLKVNGFVYHKLGSFFNQTGGEIIIDSNNNGDSATSVGAGTSSCKIETANLALTGGKITIVDPLVNLGSKVNSASKTSFTELTTVPVYNVSLGAAITSGSSTVVLETSSSFTGSVKYSELQNYVGQPISASVTGVIPAGTTITAVSALNGTLATVTLSQNTTGAMTASTGSIILKHNSGDGTYVGLINPSTTAAGSTSIILQTNQAFFTVGQPVSGAGIAPNTTITAITTGNNTTLTLSAATTAVLPRNSLLVFPAMYNGGDMVLLNPSDDNSSILPGMPISGTGIPDGTTVVSVANGVNNSNQPTGVKLSKAVANFTPSTSQNTLTFTVSAVGVVGTVLPVANPNLLVNMPVSGTGIKPGTFIRSISGLALGFSEPLLAGAPNPLVFDAYQDVTASVGSFVYSAPANYAAGLNHTLQIGDGISTQKGTVVTNGFNCVFQTPGGMISLGNLIVNAPDGDNRFMSTSNMGTNGTWGALNVQNQLTISAGSVLKKMNGISNYYVGGNIVNNGAFLQPENAGLLYLGNFINGTAVATSIPQTLSGTGVWRNDLYSLTSGSPTGSVSSLTINNTSPEGVTLNVANFRSVGTVTMTNGILHTSDLYPIATGVADVSLNLTNGGFSGGSATSYVDGPVKIAIANSSTNTINSGKLIAVGKNGKYLPITLAPTGGAEFMVEAFTANSGTVNSTNGSNLSSDRWKVSRVGTLGSFAGGYNVKLGASGITSIKIIVQSASENGTYDIVSTPASPTMTFAAGTPNTIVLGTAQTGGFLGNFAYADGPGCTGTPAPGATIASNTAPCGGDIVTLSLTTATTGAGVTYQWQSAATVDGPWTDIAGANAATYAFSPVATTSYRANVTCSGTTGTSTPVTVTVALPTVTATDDTICTPGTVNLTAQGAAKINWYDAATGGNLVATGTTFSPNVSVTSTYYVTSATESADTSANSTAYAGTSTSSANFKGISFDVNKKINLKQVTVYPKNTAQLTAVTIGLYDSSNNAVPGTSPVVFVPTLNTGAVGTVSQVVPVNYIIPAGKGYRLVVTSGLVTTNNTLGNSTGTIAYPTTVGALVLTGNVSDLNNAPNTSANNTNVFHNLVFSEICESGKRVPSTATVVNTVAPTATANQSACTTGTIADFVVTGVSGATIKWYNASNVVIPTTTPAVLGTAYFVSQTIGACEGPKASVTATNVSAPTAAASQAACTTGTIADFVVTPAQGTTVKWYDAQTAGNVLPTSTKVVVNTVYYVSQIVGTCESPRVAVTANGTQAPIPGGATTQDACATKTIADFVVTGGTGATFTWYDVATLGTPIPTTTTAVFNKTYYVSQTLNGCEGPRLAILAAGPCLPTEDFEIRQLNYYPNPVVDKLTITANDQITRVELYNLLGQQLRVFNSATDTLQVDFKDFAPAAYLVKVYSENKVEHFKVIKK